MLCALIFSSSSSLVPISSAAGSVDVCISSLPHFSSSLSSVSLFLHTLPIPLMSPKSDLGRSHRWCGGLPAAPTDCWCPWGPEGKEFPSLWNLCVESSCHVFVDSIPNRWTRHKMKDAVGEQLCLPKERERCSQLRKRERQDWMHSLSNFLWKFRSSKSWILHNYFKSSLPI